MYNTYRASHWGLFFPALDSSWCWFSFSCFGWHWFWSASARLISVRRSFLPSVRVIFPKFAGRAEVIPAHRFLHWPRFFIYHALIWSFVRWWQMRWCESLVAVWCLLVAGFVNLFLDWGSSAALLARRVFHRDSSTPGATDLQHLVPARWVLFHRFSVSLFVLRLLLWFPPWCAEGFVDLCAPSVFLATGPRCCAALPPVFFFCATGASQPDSLSCRQLLLQLGWV
jgi:hypothetical protein